MSSNAASARLALGSARRYAFTCVAHLIIARDWLIDVHTQKKQDDEHELDQTEEMKQLEKCLSLHKAGHHGTEDFVVAQTQSFQMRHAMIMQGLAPDGTPVTVDAKEVRKGLSFSETHKRFPYLLVISAVRNPQL